MKKLLCALMAAALLLCASSAAVAEDLRISLYNYILDQPEEDVVRVQLLLAKLGGVCYEMEDVFIELYNEAGQVVTPVSKEIAICPMQEIPEGDHYVPITILCTLAEPVSIADFNITGISGMQTGSSDVMSLGEGMPYIGGMADGVVNVTSWMPLEGGCGPEDYFAAFIGLDAESHYIGNGELPRGAAQLVSGDEIVSAVCESTGWTQAQLEANGFVFGAEEYAFFDRTPMPHLTDIPASFVARFYRVQTEWMASTPISRRLDRIAMEADGSFVIHGCFECTWDGLWRLDEIVSLELVAEDGSRLEIADFSFDSPFSVIEKGVFMPYVVRGKAEPGFAATDFRFALSVGFADELDFHTVPGGSIEPSVNADGTVSVSASMPTDAALDPANCFVSIMFLDLANDVYQGAVWTYPGEAWVQDGVIRVPEMTAPEGCTIEAAMATSYCVAD